MTKISHSNTSTAPKGVRRSWWRRNVVERFVLSLASAALLMAAPSCDEPDPGAEIIRVVREAELTRSYRGTKRMVFGPRGAKTWEFLVTHFAGRDGQIGPTITEVPGADSGESRTRIDWRSRHDYWLGNADLLLANYRIQSNGPAEVAGRTGTRYVVSSRYEGRARPSLEVVVDSRTGLLLSYREIDWMGEAAFLAEFTSLVVDPVDLPERPSRGEETDSGMDGAEPPAPLDFRRLVPRHLPEGFAPKGEGRRCGRSLSAWKAVWSDGLSWFEIRQWKAKEQEEVGVLRRYVKGSRVRMRMTYEGVSVALYGRLDPAELAEVLKSLALDE